MTSRKRKREMARAKAERQAARRAEAAQRRGQRNRILAILAIVVVVGGVLAWVVLNRSSEGSDIAAPDETAIPSEPAVPSDEAAPTEENLAAYREADQQYRELRRQAAVSAVPLPRP